MLINNNIGQIFYRITALKRFKNERKYAHDLVTTHLSTIGADIWRVVDALGRLGAVRHRGKTLCQSLRHFGLRQDDISSSAWFVVSLITVRKPRVPKGLKIDTTMTDKSLSIITTRTRRWEQVRLTSLQYNPS